MLAAFAPQASAETIGAVSAVNSDVDGTPPQIETRKLVLSDGVFLEERIDSSPIGSGQFLFLDQTSLTIAPNSSLVLDRYVYDPASRTGEIALSMSRGVLRFVGGRITKTAEAAITAPTATIGIRGGMAIIQLEDDGSMRVMHIAGEYTRVTTREGTSVTISRNNGVVIVSSSGEISYAGVADPAFVAEVSRALIGRGDAGERREPEDPDVAGSGVPDVNSEARGAPFARPISTSGEGEGGEGDRDGPLDRTDEDVTGPLARDALPPDEQPPERTLLAGVTGGASFAGGDAPGLTSGGDGESFVFAEVFDGSRIGVTADGEEFVIPVSEGAFSFTSAEGASPRGGIGGAGFFNEAEEFTYAVFQTDEGDTGAFLAGRPSGALDPANAGEKILRTYAISDELLSGVGVAFAPVALGGFSAEGQGDLTLISDVGAGGAGGGATGPDARAVATFLDVSGQGRDQITGFGVLTADVQATEGETPAFFDFFEGYFSDDGGQARVATSVATVEDGRENSAFGAGARFLALSNSSGADGVETIPGRLFDSGGGETQFGANHVAELTGQTMSAPGEPLALGGYAATTGFAVNDGETFAARGFQPGDFAIAVIDGGNLAVATLTLDDIFTGSFEDAPISSVEATFGGPGGRSAVIDGDRFAARHAVGGAQTVDGFDGAADGVQQGQGAFRGALASAALAGDGGIFPADVEPRSAFLSWGWWAGEFRAAPDQVANGGPESDQRFNLGAFVAGVPTGSADIPTGGVASYDGFAVVSAVQDGASFVDGAGFTLSYDFGERLGLARFQDLLGADAAVAVSAADAGGFDGVGDVTIGGRDGLIVVDGAFFNGAAGDPAGATAGSLAVGTNDGAIQGAGVFAGDRVTPPNL